MQDKKMTIAIVVVGALVALGTSALVLMSGSSESNTSNTGSEVVSQNGLHWHSQLSISIKGQPQSVPANLGIGSVHNPIHTHDANGEIHMEFSNGRVTKQQLQLGEVFKAWNQPFTETQLLGQQGGRVIMLVNGQSNTEYGRYQMKDKDKIELRYE